MHQSPTLKLPHVNASWRIGIVHSSFYEKEMKVLVESTKKALLEAGVLPRCIKEYPVYGSFEIPLVGSALIKAQEVDALIGLGIVVQGQTHHARLIAQSVTDGIMDLQVRTQVPFSFEVLYVDSLGDAEARLDRGREAAHATLHSLAQLHRIHC